MLVIDYNVRYTFVQDLEYLNLEGTPVASSLMFLLDIGVDRFSPL